MLITVSHVRLYFVKTSTRCCCNLSVDVALNARLTMNGMYVKNNTVYN